MLKSSWEQGKVIWTNKNATKSLFKRLAQRKIWLNSCEQPQNGWGREADLEKGIATFNLERQRTAQVRETVENPGNTGQKGELDRKKGWMRDWKREDKKQSGHWPGKEENLIQRKSELRIIFLYINKMVHCTTILKWELSLWNIYCKYLVSIIST